MIHLGDITQLHGDEIPVVDIITGGSPCQDLSVAGKRAGLDGERSGLFMEQIRIVKEMRERDRRTGRTAWLIRPRFMVWENVPGAFSSNGGRDFQAVLSEIVKIVEPESPDVPMPEGGRWSKSGCLYSSVGDWSIAWRVHDAQFWGVPQRRKRIALVADFGGLAAPEVLFERESLSRDSEPSGAEREGAAAATGSGVEGASGATAYNQLSQSAVYKEDDVSVSLTVCGGSNGGGSKVLIASYNAEPQAVLCAEPIPIHDQATRFKGKHGEKTDGKGNGLGVGRPGDPSPTLSAGDFHAVYASLRTYSNQAIGAYIENDKASALKQRDHKDATDLVVTAVDCRNATENAETNGALQAKPNGGSSVNLNNVCRTDKTVRRLTPLECERLQGFPDGWTDIGEWTDSKGRLHKEADSPRYKALGNSIALPFWEYLARRICALYERPATMGSLFDGIGGFPLAFERAGAKAVWASEIEEFPIAVTKLHFPEERRNNAR